MVRLKVTFKGGDLVRQGLERLRAKPIEIGRKRIYDMMIAVRSSLRKPGQKPTYPIRWDSERQRRAFFASNGFGGGIPYRRQGRYERGWVVERTSEGYSLGNPEKSAQYVGGDERGIGQSRIHIGRWNLWIMLLEREIAKLPKLIEREIQTFIDREAFR